jgi:CAAX protease family protein
MIQQNILNNASPFSKLIFSIFIVLVSFFIFLFLGVLIALPFWGIEIINFQPISNALDFVSISKMKYLQSVFAIGIFVVPPFIISWLITKNWSSYFVFSKVKNWDLVFLGCIMMITALPVINFLGEFNASMKFPSFLYDFELKLKEAEHGAQLITDAFLNINSIGGLLINLLVMAVIPALGEEFLFRGVLQRIFVEWTKNVHWGIIITAIVFSGFHFQFYGFLPRMLLGVLLGYLMAYGKSIWLPVLAHFTNNAFAVIMSYVYRDSMKLENMESFGSYEGTYIYVIVGLVLFSVMMYYFIRKSENRSLSIYKEIILKKPEN